MGRPWSKSTGAGAPERNWADVKVVYDKKKTSSERPIPNQKSQESTTKLVAKKVHGKVVPNLQQSEGLQR